jgi:ABC-2 type transport system ATP-binding protein
MIIKVENLVKKFKESVVVDKISFAVEAGEIFALLGPNGAGKTTIIKMLTTVLQPTAGTISINGYNPVKETDKVRQSFGIVFQDPSLDDELTAYENMNLHAAMYHVSAKERPEKIKSLLEFVELWDRQREYVKNFSGGMKRRLEIARGLLHHPKILFLDEPTQGLDPQTRNHIWEYIKNLNKSEKMTVFFTTHYIEEAEKAADHVIIIDHGKVIGSGTPAEITAQNKAVDLEEAFIKLTGRQIREEGAESSASMRQRFRH